jgi:hypothetical protein
MKKEHGKGYATKHELCGTHTSKKARKKAQKLINFLIF